MNPRSQAGTVSLRSANPRDVPAINLNFFKEGSDKDLQAIYEGIESVRSWLSKVDTSAPDSLGPFTELHPCEGQIIGGGGAGGGKQGGNCSVEAQKTYIKEQAYSHHASSSCKIGADGDKLAVLDSKFRVRGVVGLRVVDASSFPKVCLFTVVYVCLFDGLLDCCERDAKQRYSWRVADLWCEQVPGAFPVLPTMMLSEKATEDVLADSKS